MPHFHDPRSHVFFLFAGLLLLAHSGVFAQIPYNTIPAWSSTEDSDFGTGCDLADIDGDGWLDLAVSNGNDMVEAPNYVYLNNQGMLPTTASWSSANLEFSGHCELADMDGDGYPELMATNYIAGNWEPGSVQIYHNDGGVLETTPSWQPSDPLYSFRASFGDPDGDGDLDLAVATGESYHGFNRPNLIFFNEGGTLATTPGWVSSDTDFSYDVRFVDIDNDGDQDLAMLTSQGPVKIYYNTDGIIATEPGWQSLGDDNGNTFDFADLNGDGWLDLGVANNLQLSGSGKFKIYFSVNGSLPITADWVSEWSVYGSSVVFMDLDGDGDQDLMTGHWWGAVAAYLNQGGIFPGTPHWESGVSPVIENIVFGDLDRGGEVELLAEYDGDGVKKLFHLDSRHLQGIDRVVVSGSDLPLTGYCFDTRAGWVSLAEAPTGSVVIHYRDSREKDMVVTDWQGSTIIFTHDGLTPVHNTFAALGCRAYPNPFNPRLTIEYSLPHAALVQLDVLDLRGRRVARLVSETQDVGTHSVVWTPGGLPSGEYIYRVTAGGRIQTGKVYLVK